MARTDSYPNFFHDVSEAFREATGKTTIIKPCDYDAEIEELAANAGDISEYFDENVTSVTDNNKAGWIMCVKKLPAFKFKGFNANGLLSNAPNVKTIDLSNIDFSETTRLSNLFKSDAKLEVIDFSNKDISNVVDISYICENCKKLTAINFGNNDLNIENMSYSFSGCWALMSLDISKINFSNLKYMSSAFANCQALTSLIFNDAVINNVTNLNYTFSYMKSMKSLDLSNVIMNNITNINNAFYSSNFEDLDISGIYLGKVTTLYTMISQCPNLTNLVFGADLGKAFTKKTNNYNDYTLTISSSSKITHDSLMDVINKLYDLNLTYDVANGGTLYTQKLQLGATNLAKLTAEEIAIATNKGWNVS